MKIALITNYLTGYRMPLYSRLADQVGLEVLCYGGEGRYVPAWFADLDRQLENAPFPARRLSGTSELLTLGRRYDAVIAGFAGGARLFGAVAGTKGYRRPFVLWASIWAQPRSLGHTFALPASRWVYRHADAVVAYGPHAQRFIAPFRRDPGDVLIAPQAVEPELFGRAVDEAEVEQFRRDHALPGGPLVLYCGRLVEEKGVGVLLDAWPRVGSEATLVMIGDGPLGDRARMVPRVRLLGALPRPSLPVAYAAAEFAVLPSLATPLFREPWGLVCNEAMHQARPMIVSSAVGAAAGGLVRDAETGVVTEPGDAVALTAAVERLLGDAEERARLGAAARAAVTTYTYDAMAEAFTTAIHRCLSR